MIINKLGPMENINHKRNKCIGTEKQILKLIKSLGPYTFECALIYIQSLIRNSILYASEAIYNIKEIQYRAYEKIEYSVFKKVLKTLRSCPRHLMYLETGLVPARYQINIQVLNYLHYILNQPNDSILLRTFNSMIRNPTPGDWTGYAIELIKKYKLNLSLKEIKETESSIFKKLVKRQIHKIAFRELIERQAKGEKGKLIVYESLNMADYLLPEAALTVEEKQEIFAVRTEMNENPFNFGNKTQCEVLIVK
jgi:hypothetical protein